MMYAATEQIVTPDEINEPIDIYSGVASRHGSAVQNVGANN